MSRRFGAGLGGRETRLGGLKILQKSEAGKRAIKLARTNEANTSRKVTTS
jgi:hypothetical protein